MAEITIAKGSYSVTVYADSISDGIKNKITVVPLAQTSQKQDTGTAGTLIVDLLRNTRTIMIKGSIVSNSAKSDLINILEGGGTKGGVITLTYGDGGNKSSFSGYIESVLITQESADEPSSPPTDFAKFTVQITFVEGTQMAGS